MKVAGSAGRPAAPAGDTLGLQQPPHSAPYAGASGPAGEHDELVSGPGLPAGPRGRSGRGSGGSGGSGKRNGLRIAAVAAGAVVVVGGGAVAAMALTGGSGGGKTTVAAEKPVADPTEAVPQVDPKVMEAQRRKQALDRASRAVREDDGKGPTLLPKGSPIPTKKPDDKPSPGTSSSPGGPTGDPVPAGAAQQIAKRLLGGYGFSGSGEFGCLVNLWNKESHWNTHAANPTSGAYGIPQALPGSKMASAGSDWQNSASTQIKWGLGYIKSRYKTPCAAWQHSQSVGWY
ncbi:lytic transglycosylase domain-containing protein [Actinomadura roseirufa]|uniref:aggregation-promoting factor C-terminal-like domain-containing protein n=1 Tax=Actinomadura roseirufa TaxID=2094049 RepID=UPI0010414658|nr:lytic transglycosylase domain-containing protein [Actinomadura roseirufa]